MPSNTSSTKKQEKIEYRTKMFKNALYLVLAILIMCIVGVILLNTQKSENKNIVVNSAPNSAPTKNTYSIPETDTIYIGKYNNSTGTFLAYKGDDRGNKGIFESKYGDREMITFDKLLDYKIFKPILKKNYYLLQTEGFLENEKNYFVMYHSDPNDDSISCEYVITKIDKKTLSSKKLWSNTVGDGEKIGEVDGGSHMSDFLDNRYISIGTIGCSHCGGGITSQVTILDTETGQTATLGFVGNIEIYPSMKKIW